jgi:glycosyltransferase involved in cell wall biosynthesis
MKFLSVLDTLNPRGGGPVECAVQLERDFARLGHQMDFLTGDGIDRPWAAEDLLNAGPPCSSRRTLLRLDYVRRQLREVQDQYDLLILHGIWGLPVLGMRSAWNGQSRYAVIPHGMLDPYFIQFFPIKHIKKNFAYKTVVAPVFRGAAAVLFTCEEERRLAADSYKPVAGRRMLVRYGIQDHSETATSRSEEIRRVLAPLATKDTFLFLSRIHPKKGCDQLIKALAVVSQSNPKAHLVMAGPDDSGWTPKLKKLASRLQIEDKVTWLGPVFGADKWFLFKNTSVLILPSHMESFGMVVAEALASGQPVLVSDKVNIHTYITDAEAGFAAPDTVEGTVHLMTSWLGTSRSRRNEMSRAAVGLYRHRFQALSLAEDILALAMSVNNTDVPAPAGVL